MNLVLNFTCALLLSLTVSAAHAVDMSVVEKELTTTGVVGWVHGAASENGLFVFTYRTPGNFFDFVIMSLVSEKSELTSQLAGLSRHDKVRIKGKFLNNPSPQKHILIESLEMVTKHKSDYESEKYEHVGNIPEEILNRDKAIVLVHAIGAEGKILVVEYKDVVLPIYVGNPAVTKDLYRGDIIELSYSIQRQPNQPVHLRLRGEQPIQVMESIKNIHGKPGKITGALIMFPKSPEIIFNVFAVQQLLINGLSRQFTIVNFENIELFKEAREMLQKEWDRHPGKYVNGRNKLVSTVIKVEVSGIMNEVDPGQANPQILFNSITDIKIVQ